MRNHKFILLLLLVALLASACSENPGTTTMRLVLSSGQRAGERTVLPEDSSLLDVSKYTVSGEGPNGKRFTKTSSSSSINVEGLATGQWKVTAMGLNKDGVEIVSGSLTFYLDSSTGAKTIYMDTLVGTGTFIFEMDWSTCSIEMPSVEATLTGPGPNGREITLQPTINKDAKTAAVSDSLTAGAYILRAILKDGQHEVAGLVEAVRITNRARTSGSYTFNVNSDDPSSLSQMRDASGSPIRGSLAVVNNEGSFYDGKEYECKFTLAEPKEADVDQMTIEWFYDGNQVKSEALNRFGSVYTMVATYGAHRLDVVIFNKVLGVTWSASYCFNVLHNGKRGEMALLTEDAAAGIPDLDSESMISALPNEMFLVVCPSTAKMYICTVSSMSLQVVKTYDSRNYPWLSKVYKVFSDPSMNYVALAENSSGENSLTILMFHPESRNFEDIAGMENLTKNTYDVKFGTFLCATFDYKHKSMLFCDDNEYRISNTIREYEDGELDFCGNSRRLVGNPTYIDMDISTNCNLGVAVGLANNTLIVGNIGNDGNWKSQKQTDECSEHPTKVRFINGQTIVAVHENGISTFKTTTDAAKLYKSVDIPARDIAADGENYFYISDANRRLVSYSVSGYEILELGFTTLENQISALSLSGTYLAALTEGNTIALFQIIP